MSPRRRVWSAAACLLGLSIVPAARAEGPPTPAESLAALRLADPALRIELVAAEPDVESPVAIAWDERGRLYVAEMRDYPAAPAAGRIKRLEDRDGDGRYEHVTMFAENLPYPNGLLPWDGGLLVTAAPDLLFFQDRDGDGRAEVKRVVLTGFGEGNQQLRVNSPTWGLDNRVTLANGRSGGAVRRPDEPTGSSRPIPRNDLRLDPRTGAFEPIAGFSQFGLPRDDYGDRFPSWNTVPIRHVVLEDEPGSPPHRTVAEILDLADGGRIYSLAPAQRRFNAETVAFFNASCGPTIFRADSLGPTYRGDAFVCEPLTSVVHRRKLVPDGPTYRAVRVEAGREFLASTHPWFRPVNLATGPDGALYVVDFCRAWVEHPAFVPESQRQSVDFREGFNRGRLWRITRRDDTTRGISSSLPPDKIAGLVAALESTNGWTRDTAQRRLVELQDQATVAPLRILATSSHSNLARIHALWTLDGLGALDGPTQAHALADLDARVREQGVRLARRGNRAGGLKSELIRLADDSDSRVRLQSALTLGAIPGRETYDALARLAARDAGSPWTLDALTAAPGIVPGALLRAIAADRDWLDRPTPAQADLLARLAARTGDSADAAESLVALVEAVERAPASTGALALLEGLIGSKTGRRWYAGAPIAPEETPWKARLQGTVAAALLTALNRGETADRRALAYRVAVGAGDPAAPALTLDLLAADQPAEVQAAAAQGVSRFPGPELIGRVLERWDALTIATRRRLLSAFTASPPLARRLLDAIERGDVAASEVDPTTREAFRRLDDPALRARLAAVFPVETVDRAEVVRRHEPALALVGHAEAGRLLFEKHCQTCHTRSGSGARVGPDLLSVAGKPPADLLVAILDPSREAAPDGQAVVVATTSGQTFTGLLVEESPERVRLRRAEGVDDVVARGQIEAIRPTGRSLMPDGLEQVLSARDLADLIAFLRSTVPAETNSPATDSPSTP